jgi:hypothetical protein
MTTYKNMAIELVTKAIESGSIKLTGNNVNTGHSQNQAKSSALSDAEYLKNLITQLAADLAKIPPN